MKLSTRSRYGLKVCQLLGEEYSSTDKLSLPFIAERLSLSEPYLEQLMSLLKKDGIVNSVRGAGGGYYLSKAPEDITVGEIMRCLEGGFEFVDCLKNDCDIGEQCKTKGIWQKLYQGMNEILDNITLKEMIDEEI